MGVGKGGRRERERGIALGQLRHVRLFLFFGS